MLKEGNFQKCSSCYHGQSICEVSSTQLQKYSRYGPEADVRVTRTHGFTYRHVTKYPSSEGIIISASEKKNEGKGNVKSNTTKHHLKLESIQVKPKSKQLKHVKYTSNKIN